MKVKRSTNCLYKILLETSKNNCLMSSAEEASWLWHSRIGHVNFQAMELLSDNRMALGVSKFIKPSDVCTGCLISKQNRRPFPKQTTFQSK